MGTKGEAWVYPKGIPVGWTGKSLWQSSTSPYTRGGTSEEWGWNGGMDDPKGTVEPMVPMHRSRNDTRRGQR